MYALALAVAFHNDLRGPPQSLTAHIGSLAILPPCQRIH